MEYFSSATFITRLNIKVRRAWARDVRSRKMFRINQLLIMVERISLHVIWKMSHAEVFGLIVTWEAQQTRFYWQNVSRKKQVWLVLKCVHMKENFTLRISWKQPVNSITVAVTSLIIFNWKHDGKPSWHWTSSPRVFQFCSPSNYFAGKCFKFYL